MAGPVPKCPLRPGDPCSLCQLYVTGPQDCGLVYLVMGDDALRDELVKSRKAARRKANKPPEVSRLDTTDDDELGTDPRLEGLD
ncbi:MULTISPECIES: DUF6767 domain-containing protein [Cutibacterium]|uniref:Uncharacterized protein n=1 Tax=Cutibacterium acnes TaxID=1747 RepID=A0AA44ZES5_CUTAC|nr:MULTISPECIES: DUF6767 domain-containing protein [Cutibacterium]PEN29707.1 hypothetical protein APS59_05960 [Cutibacterium acnes]PGF27652.1 hypothetical protein B1B02_07015 [Cutibacterium acnes subsp. defendens]PGF28348.1 hypothetical protein B1B08_07010 [Cutibacterium acnes subsp. defendens]PGF39749.1 hypothetical protein B1B14_07010 [Cutibacterium acnes subsp. defendens]PGF48014.1 hypothetical protein B1B12_03945 [Cutibacterium acnes subsp. defendens]